jgi:hypothetical protein
MSSDVSGKCLDAPCEEKERKAHVEKTHIIQNIIVKVKWVGAIKHGKG